MRANAFYTNPRLTALLILFIAVMGGMAFSSLARQEDPTMTERWARVNTFLPGATAERMESLVSEPLETALREIPEIREIDSTSKAGLSVVGVELYDSIGRRRRHMVGGARQAGRRISQPAERHQRARASAQQTASLHPDRRAQLGSGGRDAARHHVAPGRISAPAPG